MAKSGMSALRRAREIFDRNMSRSAQKGSEPRPRIRDALKSRLGWLIASVTALAAGASAFTANLDSLTSRAKAFLEERAYFATLQNPYPNLLDRNAISDWRSGRVKLALYQIDGYHGALKTAPTWIKLCLTNSEIFPGLADHQFNDRSELPESYVDRQNKEILSQRLDQIDNEQREDAATLRINDPFTKLLTRSRYQLLSKYKDSELPQLDKAELYLLRNAIYARRGYPFNTAKLSKFSNRMGWTRPPASRKPLSQIEACNAFFSSATSSKPGIGLAWPRCPDQGFRVRRTFQLREAGDMRLPRATEQAHRLPATSRQERPDRFPRLCRLDHRPRSGSLEQGRMDLPGRVGNRGRRSRQFQESRRTILCVGAGFQRRRPDSAPNGRSGPRYGRGQTRALLEAAACALSRGAVGARAHAGIFEQHGPEHL